MPKGSVLKTVSFSIFIHDLDWDDIGTSTKAVGDAKPGKNAEIRI